MKAIIWKELRENAKWAAIGLLSMLSILAFRWYEARFGRVNMKGLLDDEILAPLFFISAGTAFGLGLLQTVLEVRRDQWAFLMHRGVSATHIFLAKTTAGLLLYLGAVAVPFLLLAARVAYEGIEVRPYHWTTIMPGLATILGSAGLYFAGMLIAVRQARWYGSRLLPVVIPAVAVLGVLFYTSEINEGGSVWLFLFLLAVDVTMALAAWGSFVNSGETQREPKAGNTALGVVLTVPMLTLLVISFACVVGTIEEYKYYERRANPIKSVIYPALTRFGVDKRGHAWQYDSDSYESTQPAPLPRATDLDDPESPVLENQSRDDMNKNVLPMHAFYRWSEIWVAPGRSRSRRIFSRMSVPRVRQLSGPPAQHSYLFHGSWYYSRPHGLLLGYRQERIGRYRTISHLERWVGPDGFAPTSDLPERRFGRFLWDWRNQPRPSRNTRNKIEHWDRQFYVFTDGIYEIDFVQETVKQIYAAPEDDPIRDISIPIDKNRPQIAIAHAQAIRIFEANEEIAGTIENRRQPIRNKSRPPKLSDEKKNRDEKKKDEPEDLKVFLPGKLVESIRMPDDVHRFFDFRFGKIEGEENYAYVFDPNPLTAGLFRVVIADAEGNVVRRHDLQESIPKSFYGYDSLAAVGIPLAVAAPVFAIDGIWQTARGTGPGFAVRMLRIHTGRSLTFLALMFGSALGCFFYTRAAANRRGLTRSTFRRWAVINTLLGPAGLLVFMCMHDRPVRETCPACDTPRVVDRKYCEHCDAPFNRPTADGTEIFGDGSIENEASIETVEVTEG